MAPRRAIDGWPNAREPARSVAGDRGDESGDLFSFLALVQHRRHLSEPAARPSAIAFSTSALRPAAVEMSSPTRTSRFGPIRPTDLPPRACGRPRRCARTVRGPSPLRRSGALRRPPRSPCVRRYAPAQARARPTRTRTAEHDTEGHRAPAGLRFGVQRLARAARAAAHRDEEHREAENDPEEDEPDDHARREDIGCRRRTARSRRRDESFSPLGAPKLRRYPGVARATASTWSYA